MNRLDNYIDNKIGEVLLAENAKKEFDHVSSGRLSASKLNDPLQWQILHAMGIPTAEVDEYTVRKFKRGNHVEDWIMEYLEPKAKQVKAEYRDCIGYIDAVCDTSDWNFPVGIIPVEVKSVANAKYKRITKQHEPDKGHLLQGAYYGMALESKQFALCYIATDDYRVQMYIRDTDEFREEIDTIITKFQNAYQNAMIKGEVPVFEEREIWQKNPKYNRYSEYMGLTAEELWQKLAAHKQVDSKRKSK